MRNLTIIFATLVLVALATSPGLAQPQKKKAKNECRWGSYNACIDTNQKLGWPVSRVMNWCKERCPN